MVTGLDNSTESLNYAGKYLAGISNCELINGSADNHPFETGTFDIVACIQNGICVFGVNQHQLIEESIRVAKPGGRILFSTYSDKFWDHRLEWFEIQSKAGLLGEIDYENTENGMIVCKDGFRARILDSEDFAKLTKELNLSVEIYEIDDSSLFCEIIK